MPTLPPIFRPRGAPTRQQTNQEYEARRRKAKPWRALYATAQWQSIRRQVLDEEPLCRRCTAEGRVEPATVVHHVHRHEGDPVKFFEGPFEPLCKTHHDSEAQREELREASRQRRTP